MIQLEAILTSVVYKYTLRLRWNSGSNSGQNQTSLNRAGTINNLATSDTSSIATGVRMLHGKHALSILNHIISNIETAAFYSPVMVIQSLWFLFGILEWR
jgi:hypothetical protein